MANTTLTSVTRSALAGLGVGGQQTETELENLLSRIPGNLTGIGVTAGYALSLANGKNDVGTPLVATSQAAGNFVLSNTTGTSVGVTGNAAQNNTKTDKLDFFFELPSYYVGGVNISIVAHALYVVSAGTTLTDTLAAHLYVVNDDGTYGSDLVTTTAQALTTSDAAYTFAVTGTTLLPGQRVMIQFVSVATEGGNTGTVKNQINSVRLL